MVTVRMGDDGQVDRPPGVDIEASLWTV
jgi:hypothetical protein